MKISHIREFLLLVSNRNYSKTAEQLYMAQSALSRHISAMEEELGVQLINRSTTTFTLTEEGTRAVEGFQKVLDEYQNTLFRIGASAEKVTGELRLGILYYDMNTYVAQIRNAFRRNYPDASLRLISCQPEQAESALLHDEADVILIYNPCSVPGKDLRILPFLKCPYYVYFDKNSDLAGKEKLCIKDLEDRPLLAPPDPLTLNNTSHVVSGMYKDRNICPGPEIPVTNFDEVPVLIEENDAVFISPMANPFIYQGSSSYAVLEEENYSAAISAVWKANNPSPLISPLIHTIKMLYA